MTSKRITSRERTSTLFTHRSARQSFPVLALLASALCAPQAARADTKQSEPASETENHLIWAARACYLEATWREADCIALLYVVRKRADRVSRDWLDVLRDYSALNANNPRAREVREFPWGDVSGKPDGFNRRWQRLRALVVEFASGQHIDPCPRAEHWGGKMDKPRGKMVKARCAASTANTFYAVRK